LGRLLNKEDGMSLWKVSKSVKIELKDKDELVEYEAELDISVVHDAHYGADADGNRSEARTFIDEVIIRSLRNTVTGEIIPEDKIPNEAYVQVWAMLDADTIDLDPPEYDEVDPD